MGWWESYDSGPEGDGARVTVGSRGWAIPGTAQGRNRRAWHGRRHGDVATAGEGSRENCKWRTSEFAIT